MAAAKKAVLITHGGDGPQNKDHASKTLAQLGYELDWRMPDQGMALPEIDDSIAITVIYGGGKPADEKDWHTDRYPWLGAEISFAKNSVAAGIPTVGFCLGGQIIARGFGSVIGPNPEGSAEFGYYPLKPTEAGKDLLPNHFRVTQAHYHGFSAPDGATILASTDAFSCQAFAMGETTYGFQFHPECSWQNFQRWQDKCQSLYALAGSQAREEQDQFAEEAHSAQAKWLEHFLNQLAGPA